MALFGFFNRRGGTRFTPCPGGDERICHFRLKGVDDPFDAQALWDSRSGLSPNMKDTWDEQKGKRLRQALDLHRTNVSMTDEQRSGWIKSVPHVFTDVVVWLPRSKWLGAITLGGDRIAVLSNNLERMHEEDFGDALLAGRSPSYKIMGHDDIADDEVLFQFGLGVFVPRGDERETLKVFFRRQKESEQIEGEWLVPQWENSNRDLAPVTLSEKQSFLLLGSGIETASVSAPVWFEHGKGTILINAKDPSRPDIFGDLDGWVEESGKPTRDADGGMVFKFRDGGGPEGLESSEEIIEVRILPTVERKGNAEEIPDPRPLRSSHTVIEQPVPDGESPGYRGSFTIIGGEEPRFQLALEAYALPNVYRRYLGDITGWRLNLDREGGIADSDGGIVSIAGYCDRQGLHALDTTDRHEQVISSLPWSMEETEVTVLPSPYPKAYLGILPIPIVWFATIDEQQRTLGRRDLDERGEQPEVSFDQLSIPGSLLWKGGHSEKEESFLGNLFFSRNHATVWVDEEGRLNLKPISGAGTYTCKRSADTAVKVKQSDTVVLEPGDRIIAGGYVLRFEDSEFVDDVEGEMLEEENRQETDRESVEEDRTQGDSQSEVMQIANTVREYLGDLKGCLERILPEHLKQIGGDNWWRERVVDKLTAKQQKNLKNNNPALENLDRAAILRVVTLNYGALSRNDGETFPWSAKSLLEEAKESRNDFDAHLPSRIDDLNDLCRSLDTLRRLLTMFGATSETLEKISIHHRDCMRIHLSAEREGQEDV